MIELGVLFLIVFFGSVITGLSGFGGGSIVLAGMMVLFPPEVAIPLHGVTQLIANAGRVLFFLQKISWNIVWYYSLLILPASWLGVLFFNYFDPNILKVIVGVFIIYSILPFKFKIKTEPSKWTFTFLGAISGFLSVFVGAVGPFVTPYFNRIQTSREGNISTKSAAQMMLQLFKILAFSKAGMFTVELITKNAIPIFGGTFLGIFISHLISKKISDEVFNLVINFLLLIVSVKIIFEGIQGLVT